MVAGQRSSSRRGSAFRWLQASIICAASAAELGCSSGGELPQDTPDVGPPAELAPGVIRVPFLVDDYFVPNGCFGDGDCAPGVININSRACTNPPATVQGTCRLYTYKPLPVGAPRQKNYLGILFQDVGPGGEGRIGYVPGRPVQAGAKRVVFWAKVGGAPMEVAFRVGGANNWEGNVDSMLPYKDTFGVPGDQMVTREFQQFSIDLTGVKYDDVVSAFGWALVAVTEPVELYIADVRWE